MAGGKRFQFSNGAIQGKTGVEGKKKNLCHSIYRHLSDCNVVFKISPMKEGLFPSLNSGTALHMLGRN